MKTHLRQQRIGALHNAEYDINIPDSLHISEGDSRLDPERDSLEAAHQILTEVVAEYLQMPQVIPVVIGGSNDQSFPNAMGLLRHLNAFHPPAVTELMLVINIDAHLDVRPLIEDRWAHSGSPFRQLLEDHSFMSERKGKFIEFAAQSSQCSIHHAKYVQSKGGDIVWIDGMRSRQVNIAEEFRALLKRYKEYPNVFVSFDLDSICSSVMPGVSSPSPLGLTAFEACSIAMISGRDERVRLMDLSEFNPVVEEYASAKLVATILYYFAMGVADRRRIRTE